MKFRVIREKTASGAHSPIYVIEQDTGTGVGWINRYLDREYVRRLANKSLYSYAHSLLHFVRWWDSVHHTGDIAEADLTESTLLDYLHSSLASNHRHLRPLLTTEWPVPIAPSVTSSPMLPVKPHPAFTRSTCIAGRWARSTPDSI